ncbi:MAG: hypothetical protein NTW76_14280 [Corynebacteriales bacterium]|nr:hypothetical protein [Mycobacteriales bacterium]
MDTINGIPAHPLFVHLTVVAIPLAAILGILAVVWPAARRKIGIIAPVVGLVAVIMTPLTTSAGESLEKKVGPNQYLADHTELGDKMIIVVAPLFVFIVVFWALNNDWIMGKVASKVSIPARAVTMSSVAAAVIVVGFAIAAIVMVYLVGESGARSVWLG